MAVKILTGQDGDNHHDAILADAELRAIGRMHHRNIVRAIDAREVRGTRLLVMEYFEGLNLSELTDRLGPLCVPDACELIRQAACGLHHIHAMRIVHRDMKPSNLVLTVAGQIKIVDFGLALLLDWNDDDTISCLQQHRIVGTPGYMAPEQLTPGSRVDARVDIYSLGVTLYRILGRAPPLTRRASVCCSATRRGPSDRGAFDLRRFRPDVTRKLDWLLRGMVARDPDRRIPSANIVAAALEPMSRGCDLAGLAAEGKKAWRPQTSTLAQLASTSALAPQCSHNAY